VLKIAALVLASAAGVLGASAASSATATSKSTPAPSASPATSSSSGASSTLSNSSWWEKVTVTLDGDGKPEACRYETSLTPTATEDCDVGSEQAAVASKASENKGEITRITFERRFNPGDAPTKPTLQTGDTLLGGQVMALAIDAKGAVKDCRIVAASGAMRPQYSCDDASAEKFQASYSAGKKEAPQHEGYMTILVYGHSEHMV